MQPNVMTRYHVKVIWITFAAIGVITLLLYGYGRLVPTANPEKQSAVCVGAKNSLAELQKNPAETGASPSKIDDARQLAETECAK